MVANPQSASPTQINEAMTALEAAKARQIPGQRPKLSYRDQLADKFGRVLRGAVGTVLPPKERPITGEEIRRAFRRSLRVNRSSLPASLVTSGGPRLGPFDSRGGEREEDRQHRLDNEAAEREAEEARERFDTANEI